MNEQNQPAEERANETTTDDLEKELRDVIEQIQTLEPIEELVGRVAKLAPEKPRGRKLYGACPWNSLHARNLIVYPARGFFRCWLCRKEGDVVAFVAAHERVTRLEAIRRLANRLGLTLPPLVEKACKPAAEGQ